MSAVPLNFMVGDTLSVQNCDGLLELLRVVERKRSGYLLKPLDDNDASTWSDDRIAEAYFQRRLKIHPCNVFRLPEAAVEVIEKTWEYWPAEIRCEAERRLEYVREVDLVRCDHPTLLAAYQAAADAVHSRRRVDWAAEDLFSAGERSAQRRSRKRRATDPQTDPEKSLPELKDPVKPNAYTIRNWYLRWSGFGRDIRLLIPYSHKRGNRRARYAREVGDCPDSYKLMAVTSPHEVVQVQC